MSEKFRSESGNREEDVKIVSLDEVNKFLSDNPNIKERILGEDIERVKKEGERKGGAFHILSKEQTAEIFKEMGVENAKLEEPKQVFWTGKGLEVKDMKWAEETEKGKRYEASEYKGEKTISFELLGHPTPSVAELLKVVEKEFPGVSLDDLEITSGEEVFSIAKKEKGEKSE